ncbi:TetR family transcriptional regulator [Kribbella sp. NBC_01245]|uniref:TetR/AcrR family transcriptional regulator n=1 Tax=Kribbella sp. NBC_01245 TaxID=2903578 RepID=UPI002E2896A9|nr:TetR family transcriptional regulator [Kribbella sp. NBC_01245]
MAGRRPGGPDTRGEILTAARESFASKGFDRTSIRGVARDARVDAALVHHYFDGKEELFIAALELPVDPRVVAATLVQGPIDDLGVRILTAFLGVWESADGQSRMKAMVRGAVTSDEVAKMLREGITRMILGPVAARLGTPDAAQRVALVASQMMGLVLVRYVLELEPIASASTEELIARVAPTLQAYLTD